MSWTQKNEIFTETAHMMSTTVSIIEKDFWVVWVLGRIFSDARLNSILIFKGGTSLSKVFHLIGRFSEDIDLILDWRLVTQEDPYKERSSNQQNRFNTQINDNAKNYIQNTLLGILEELLSPYCRCSIEPDGFSLSIEYPSNFKDTYIKPTILLEIGPLASWLPHDSFEIESFVAEQFPALFTQSKCRVNTIVAERTFWEKVTILHHEANRPENSLMPSRYSRHYYDLAIMAQSNVKEMALSDLNLLKNVIEFKQRFYPRTWAKYDQAFSKNIKLMPPKYRIAELKKDYSAMKQMIFSKYISFEEILETLERLEIEIRSLFISQ